MRHRWANTSLLVLIIFQVITGAFGLAAGSEDRAVYLLLHNIGAFTIVGVLIWKTAIGARSLRRSSRGRPRGRTIFLTILLLATLILGFSWPTLGYWSVSGTSGMTLHIATGIALTPLLGFHAWRYTRRFTVGYDADRRAAMRLMGLGGAGFASWLVFEGAFQQLGLNASHRRFTGSHERRSFQGNAFPTTSWLNDDPRQVRSSAWVLKVSVQDEEPFTWPYEEVVAGANASGPTSLEATLDCTGGWYSRQVWSGPKLADVLPADLPDGVRTVEVRSITGYYRRFAFDQAKDFLLATHFANDPFSTGDDRISHGHGFPLRLVAPGRRGFEWVKWVTEIRLTSSSHWLQPPFPLQ